MRKALFTLILLPLVSGCFFADRNTARVPLFAGLIRQQQQIPQVPLREWVTVDDLPLDGVVSARMTITDGGDLYLAYAQSLLQADPAKAGLPVIHMRARMKGAKDPSDLTAPTLDPATTTAGVLALQSDGAGNVFLLTTTYTLSTDTTAFQLYRYPSGTTTPSNVTLPTSFQGSTQVGSGFLADRKSGKLYLAGTHVTATTSVATVAVSSDGGTTWTLKDASATTGTSGFGIAVDSDDTLYLAGGKPIGTTSMSWVLYRSKDAGASFTELDSAMPTIAADGASSRAEYVGIGEPGHLITVGSEVIDPPTLATAIVVRESIDAGASWKETTRFSARAYPIGADTQLGLMVPHGLALGPSGFAAVPVAEAKKPSAYLLVRSPVLGGTWTTALRITALTDGEPYMQGVEFDSTTGQLYLLTNYLKYTARQSSLRLTRF